jgi:hypothetical protein
MSPYEEYFGVAIEPEAAILSEAQASTQNNKFNRSLGTVGEMPTDTAISASLLGAGANGYLKDHGEIATRKVIERGFESGQTNTRTMPERSEARPSIVTDPPPRPEVRKLIQKSASSRLAVSGAWKSSVVTAEVLRTKQFPAPQIILPGLICEGVTILASKPKVGKSWLALDVCIATAANRFTLGSLRPKTGDVLYLALEDSQRRLQRRVDRILSAVSEAWPARLAMATEWRRVDEGGLDDIREWCDGVTEPILIVIDTLAKIRSAKGSNKPAYDVDYEAVAGLHKIANRRGIAIVIIHHTRKMGADDAFDTVSGTLGLTGAADTILVLDKRAGAVTLHARGRDIEESETALQFNKETCRWTILGAAGEVHRSNERSRIIEALTGASDGLRVTEIKALAEFSRRGAVDVLLSKMVKAGEIERLGRGLYGLPSDAGKIGEKERSLSQDADLIAENSNLTNLTNLSGDLSCQPATMGKERPPRSKDSNEVEDVREP